MGLWVRPLGPALWGVYWLPYLVFGIVMALVIAAATPFDDGSRRRRLPRTATPEAAAEADTVVAVGTFVWITLVVLSVAVAIGYLW